MRQNGNKASYLAELKNVGYDVPDFTVISLRDIADEKTLNDAFSTDKTSRQTAGEIDALLKYASGRIAELLPKFDPPYAVRSSAAGEDGRSRSMAGRFSTFLHVATRAEAVEKVAMCMLSQLGTDVIAEMRSAVLPADAANVIVQEMVNADIGGVAFGVNPVNCAERVFLIEATKGAADKMLGGLTVASACLADWSSGLIRYLNEPLLSEAEVRQITELLSSVQSRLGFPVDIEFAFCGGAPRLLQARPITAVGFPDLTEHFTTANFRDGGVSSEACKALMRSLYLMTYDSAVKDFFVATKAFKRGELTPQIRNFCGRLYWNVTSCKTASAKVPGFVERLYDEELGLYPRYKGDGLKSRVTPGFLWNLPKIALVCRRIFRANLRGFESLRARLTEVCGHLNSCDLTKMSLTEIGRFFTELIEKDYFCSETAYFTQVCINIVRLSQFRRLVYKRHGKAAYIDALSGIGSISHTKMFAAMLETAKEVSDAPENKKFWSERSLKELTALYLSGSSEYGMPRVREFLSVYGYHSDRETDISYPSFAEQPEKIIGEIRALALAKNGAATREKSVEPSDSAAREKSVEPSDSAAREKPVEPSTGKLGKSRQAVTMRRLLWQREELKDISTRYYALIRKAALALEGRLKETGAIRREQEIFQAEYGDIKAYLTGGMTAEELQGSIDGNTKYHSFFVNYEPCGDIGGQGAQENAKKRTDSSADLSGVGCGGGRATGRARVLNGVGEISQIRKDEILVAKFFDVGWISRFCLLKGSVTETGGVLCHSSIVSREYGIPAIVSVRDAVQKIKTGDLIEINGATGEIFILERN